MERFEIIRDDERFGLKKGDVVICGPMHAAWASEKVAVHYRERDGYRPECSQYRANVKKLDDPDCKCGHPLSSHYEFCDNGKPATNCRACDPFVKAGAKGGTFVIDAGSKFHQQYEACTHKFEASNAKQN